VDGKEYCDSASRKGKLKRMLADAECGETGEAPGQSPGLPNSSPVRSGLLLERLHGCCFVILHIKNGVELGDLQ
jgi:hypothetical protein